MTESFFGKKRSYSSMLLALKVRLTHLLKTLILPFFTINASNDLYLSFIIEQLISDAVYIFKTQVLALIRSPLGWSKIKKEIYSTDFWTCSILLKVKQLFSLHLLWVHI